MAGRWLEMLRDVPKAQQRKYPGIYQLRPLIPKKAPGSEHLHTPGVSKTPYATPGKGISGESVNHA